MKNNHKMEIVVKEIPVSGLRLDFDASATPWFLNCLKEALGELHKPGNGGKGALTLLRTGPNVDCEGEVEWDCAPVCSRCLKGFRRTMTIPIHLTLAPLYESEEPVEAQPKEEVELVKEDLEFSYYENGRFDLAGLIREQIVLELPMQPLCRPDCKGLCPVCGQNLNENPCACEPESADLRWQVLKSLKLKSR